MGQEINALHFRHHDFLHFDRMIRQEMQVLKEWFESGRFSQRGSIGGLELETWLIDSAGLPIPVNQQLLERLNSPDVVPELSQFNVEFNVTPQPLAGHGIETLARELETTWNGCATAAAELGARVVAIGTLPTLADELLRLETMSPQRRYRALNEQTLRLREGRPIRLEIEGRERLVSEHRDVMLEAATTSFQLHLQVPFAESVRYFNASVVASAPLVAVAANAPFLFGKRLWHETRIPLFEQAIDVGAGRYGRVSFGVGYARESLLEFFVENLDHFPVMLPLALDDASEKLVHTRLHNGTIWRWNRPLLGFDDDGTPHLRIEQRVMPAGPTVVDMAANMALFYGLAEALALAREPPEDHLPFLAARENFYNCARHGLKADVVWLDGRQATVRDLVLGTLLPLAKSGLAALAVEAGLASRLLQIIEQRVASGQNGAVWQQRFFESCGHDLACLTREYADRQQAGEPVHTWSL